MGEKEPIMHKRLAQFTLLCSLALLAACGQIGQAGTGSTPAANDTSDFPNPGTNILYALNATTGATRWQTPINTKVSFTGSFFNQVIYLGTNDGASLSASSASDGKQLWQAALDNSGSPANEVATVVAVVDGTVSLSTSTRFSALKASDGSLLWKTPVNPFAFLLSVQGGIVYGFSTSKDTSTAGQNGVFALKASDGTSLWSYPVAAVHAHWRAISMFHWYSLFQSCSSLFRGSGRRVWGSASGARAPLPLKTIAAPEKKSIRRS